MPHPLLCLDAAVRHVAERFRAPFSKPQEESVATVLLGLLEGEGTRMLSGMRSKIAQPPSVRGLRRLLSESPWVAEDVVVIWQEPLRTEMQLVVATACEPVRQAQPKRRGRPTQLLATGSLRGDDSTMSQPKGRTMDGVSTHQSTTHELCLVGHSLVQAGEGL